MTQPFLRALFAGPVLLMLAAPGVHAEARVYGKLMPGLEYVDSQAEAGGLWQVSSHASRVGVKGGMPTGTDGLEVVYQLEWEVDISDEARSSNDHFKARNQFAGLSGRLGTVIIGRHDTPFKDAAGDVDLFNDIVDIKRIMAGGENREDNIYQYTTPALAERFSVSFMGMTREDPAAGEDGPADAISSAVHYRDGDLHLAAAFDSEVEGPGTGAARLAGGWHGETFGFGGLVQSSDYNTGTDETVILASGYYAVNKMTFKLQAGSTSDYGGTAGHDADLTAAGVDYTLSESTTVGAYLAGEEGGDVGAGLERDTVGFVLIHKF